jgi:hypothetical protein
LTLASASASKNTRKPWREEAWCFRRAARVPAGASLILGLLAALVAWGRLT